jgi:hypothetical protein
MGVTAPYVVPARALGKDGQTPPSERIEVVLIGCGGMGQTGQPERLRPTSDWDGLFEAFQARLERMESDAEEMGAG